MNIKKSTWLWIGLGVLAILVRMIFGQYPECTEQVYSRGIFPVIRYLLDYTVGLMPFPVIYIFVVILIIALIVRIKNFILKKERWSIKIIEAVLGVLAFLGGGVFLFLFMWGYNYSRVPLETQLQLSLHPLSVAELKTELAIVATDLIAYRKAIPGVTDSALTADYFPDDLEDQLRFALMDWLQKNNYPTPGNMQGRMLLPKGIFLRFSSSGLYFPFTGEGNVDAGLLHLQRPFVMAHELSHGYGFGDEGTCNFLGYVACINSDNPVIRYAGQLGYYRYLASDYLRYKPEAYQAFRAALPAGIPNDLNAINTNLNKYPDIMPKLRYAAYDTYLKAQGIEEGMKNYNRIVMLAKAYRIKNKK